MNNMKGENTTSFLSVHDGWHEENHLGSLTIIYE